MRTVPPKKPKKHRGVPELNPEHADDLPDEFTLRWQGPPVYDYKVVSPSHFNRLLDEILVLSDGPLPEWAMGEGWRNVAGPEKIEVRRRRRFGPKKAADYEGEYWHERGDSDHDDPDHEVEFTLAEMVFVEAGDDDFSDHWLPRYKRRS